jgi:4-carboxymuconolactone decarboxylase
MNQPGHPVTRTPFLTPDQMDPEQRRVYEDIVRSRGTWLNGPYAPLLQSPELADKAQVLGELLRYRTSLGPMQSELAILVTARHWDCQFEWYQHEKVARREGIPESACMAIGRGDRPDLANAKQAATYDFASQLLGKHFVDDDTYRNAQEVLGVKGVVELTALIGYYTLIALTLNAHEVPLPAGVVPQLPKVDKP